MIPATSISIYWKIQSEYTTIYEEKTAQKIKLSSHIPYKDKLKRYFFE
jgi:hypothetical protein